ncbi:MAG: hypothetical protein IPJ43_02680 [Saprospiraceae bacterium]|nr:hypothetical protein [Saprospiraceae bacterium]
MEKPLELSDRGNLIVVGCGTGTIIRSKNSEAAFIFSKCTSVTLRDLYAESTITGKDNYTNNLNGVATFLNCIQVDVENSTFKTGLGSHRASTCITVRK